MQSVAKTQPPVYFVLHIPRTAGQTIQYHLLDNAVPGSVWLPAVPPRSRRRDPPVRGAAVQIRAVTGHHVGRSLEAGFAGREIRRAVLLRDPLSVQLSLYNYRMMNHLNKGLGTYSFDLHLRALPRDWMTHWLLHRWLEIPWSRLLTMPAVEKYRRLNKALAGFWFVGTHSDCDRLIAAMAPDLGVPSRARPRNTARQWHKQIYWEALTAEALGPERRAAVLARNPVDCAVWESWRGAGFAPASVAPPPLDGATDRSAARFCADEAARAGFLLARWIRREFRPRLPFGRARGGLRSGIVKADRARDRGEWRLAAEHYRRALSEEPRAPAIWLQYGHMLKLCGDVDGAERAYRQAMRLDPDDADAQAELSRLAQMRQRQLDLAGTVSGNRGSG